jgi:hypothetical protein
MRPTLNKLPITCLPWNNIVNATVQPAVDLVRSGGRFARASGVVLLLLAPVGAWAQYMYVCNVQGHTYSGQELPDECRTAETRVLNRDGSLHERIPAPLSAAEKQMRDNDARSQARLDEAKRTQVRQDRALLETYASIDSIEQARQRALASSQSVIDRTSARIDQLQKEQRHLTDESQFYTHRDMPVKLKDALAANQVLLAQQEKSRSDALTELTRINERYDTEMRRFKELRSGTSH